MDSSTLRTKNGSTTRSTTEQIVHALHTHKRAILDIQKSCEKRNQESQAHLDKINKLQAECKLIRLDMLNFVTDDELNAVSDRVSKLEADFETPQQRESRLTLYRLIFLYTCLISLAVVTFVVTVTTLQGNRINNLEQRAKSDILQPYPGRYK
jgi:hypothetical protein